MIKKSNWLSTITGAATETFPAITIHLAHVKSTGEVIQVTEQTYNLLRLLYKLKVYADDVILDSY